MANKKDRRKINKTWEFTNPLGERYRFGRKGSGKNSVIVTLAYLGKELTAEQIKKYEEE